MELQTAIYTTLLHSLWMGLILALLTSLIIVSTRKQSAEIRYNLLAGTLMLFVFSIGFVFYQNFSNNVDQALVSEQQTVTESQISPKVQAIANDSLLTTARSVVSFWGDYSNQIVLIWFLIICAKSVQLLIGLHGIRYIKTNKVFSAGSLWEQKVADISKKLSITKPVLILQSGLARVPMIVGHFKPVILIPLGLLNGLGVNEVDAIISHELAHLKRNDYLVNLIQSFVEIVFFFNPGVLWISKLIKEERENCCDDLALSCTENKHQYIKALIVCQEFSATYPNYGMAITGRKNSLKNRVNRMVFDSNSSLNRIEKTVLSIGLVSLLVFATAFTTVRNYVKENNVLAVKEVTGLFDTTSQDTSKRPAARKEFKKTLALKPKKTSVKSSRQNLEDVKAYQEEVKAYQADVKRYQADVRRQQNQIKSYQADISRYQTELKKYQSDVAKYAASPNTNKLPTVPTVPVIPVTPIAPIVPMVPVQPEVTTINAVAGNPISVTVNRPLNISVPIRPGSGKTAARAKDGDMTEELRRQGLLKDTKNFKYTLNEESLIINGVKQPENIHRRYIKYLKNKKGTITTTVSTD
ncbi:MAG: M56 family metallopeptidase [Pedobacter sp.]